MAGAMAAVGTGRRHKHVFWHSPSPWHTVILVTRLKQRCTDGGFTLLFRGQANVDWRLTASFDRLDPDQARLEERALEVFGAVLTRLLEETDLPVAEGALAALAQHCEIPTRLLDFTTASSARSNRVLATKLASSLAASGADRRSAADIGLSERLNEALMRLPAESG